MAHVNREEAWSKEARCERRKEWRVRTQGRKEAERRPAGVLKDGDLEGWEQSGAIEFSIRTEDVALATWKDLPAFTFHSAAVLS